LIEFKVTYNATWIMERHGYKTPFQVRKEFKSGLKEAA
jgi:hypothetical protein